MLVTQPVLPGGATTTRTTLDTNNDGFVDLKDVILGLHVITGIEYQNPYLQLADVNDDGRYSIAEVIYAMQIVASLRN